MVGGNKKQKLVTNGSLSDLFHFLPQDIYKLIIGSYLDKDDKIVWKYARYQISNITRDTLESLSFKGYYVLVKNLYDKIQFYIIGDLIRCSFLGGHVSFLDWYDTCRFSPLKNKSILLAAIQGGNIECMEHVYNKVKDQLPDYFDGFDGALNAKVLKLETLDWCIKMGMYNAKNWYDAIYMFYLNTNHLNWLKNTLHIRYIEMYNIFLMNSLNVNFESFKWLIENNPKNSIDVHIINTLKRIAENKYLDLIKGL